MTIRTSLGAGLLTVVGLTGGVLAAQPAATASAAEQASQVALVSFSVPAEKECNFKSLKTDGALKCSDAPAKEVKRTKEQRKWDAAIEACSNDLTWGVGGTAGETAWDKLKNAWKKGGWKKGVEEAAEKGGGKVFGPASAASCAWHGREAYRNAK